MNVRVQSILWQLISISTLFFQGLVCAQTQTPAYSNNLKRNHIKASPVRPEEKIFTLVGAGDIAGCKSLEGAKATAKLIEKIPGTVFAAGDLAYETGTPHEFELCYGPTWGRFKDRTKPALGNHEYADPTAHGYFDYWGPQAGPAGKAITAMT